MKFFDKLRKFFEKKDCSETVITTLPTTYSFSTTEGTNVIDDWTLLKMKLNRIENEVFEIKRNVKIILEIIKKKGEK